MTFSLIEKRVPRTDNLPKFARFVPSVVIVWAAMSMFTNPSGDCS
jgi:hypothetical protein